MTDEIKWVRCFVQTEGLSQKEAEAEIEKHDDIMLDFNKLEDWDEDTGEASACIGISKYKDPEELWLPNIMFTVDD